MKIRKVFGLVKQNILRILDYIIPKDDRLIYIYTSEYGNLSKSTDIAANLGGNSRAIYEYVRQYDSRWKLYFEFIKKNGEYQLFCDQSVGLFTLKGMAIFLRARILITEQTNFWHVRIASKKKIVIDVDHGIAFKKTGVSKQGVTKAEISVHRKYGKKNTFTVVPSSIVGAIHAMDYCLDGSQMLNIGYLRNDILINGSNIKLKSFIGNQIKNINYDYVFLIVPTYRDWNGRSLLELDDFNYEYFEKFLKKNNAIALLRNHSANTFKEFLRKKTRNKERIIRFDYDVCVDVNYVLSEVDVLIGDYSSIYSDYLLLDKPIISFAHDLEDYQKYRGISFDDYKLWRPGPVVERFKDMLIELESILAGKDEYKEHRMYINRILNANQDGRSCEHLFDKLDKIIS